MFGQQTNKQTTCVGTYVSENANTDKSLDVRIDKQHDYLYEIEFNCGYIF